jgi:glycosyltransferase involved in cell wall biosynthesis
VVFPSERKSLTAAGATMSHQLISILTPSFNQGAYLERNILSVLNQNYPSFEHIVIDGGSTDNSLDILKKYPHLKWVSEKDKGQADALNKGLEMATGEIIGWINSDDFYEANIFNAVAKEFEDADMQWIIGNLTVFYEESSHKIPIKSPTITYDNLLRNFSIVKQPATFFRKSIIEQAGAWNATFHLVMDYDLWLRLSKKYPPKMVDQYWAIFTLQKEQKSLGKNLLKQSLEIRSIMKREGAPFHYFLKIFIKNYYYYIKFQIKSLLITIGLVPPKYRCLNLINRNKY